MVRTAKRYTVVLAAICKYAEQNSGLMPTLPELAALTKMKISTVRGHIDKLLAEDVLERTTNGRLKVRGAEWRPPAPRG